MSYQSFVKLAGQPSWASSALPTTLPHLPSVGFLGTCEISEVPSVKELGYEHAEEVHSEFICISEMFFVRITEKKNYCSGRVYTF